MESTINRAIAPAVHDFGQLTLPPILETRLPNGITLHTVNGGDNDVSRITIALPAGEYESPEVMLASIAMTTLQEGTLHHSGEQIANLFEYNGAWVGCSVSTHYSTVTLHSLNSNLANVLPQVVEMIVEPAFHQEAVNAILKRRIAKLEVDREKVSYLASEAMQHMMYGDNSPLARVITPEKLLAISPEALSSYHKSRLDTSGIHVYLAGKLTQEIIKLTGELFSNISTNVKQPVKPIVFPSGYTSKSEKIVRAGSLQSAVNMMIPSIGREHPDYVSLRAAVIALGGYFGSRLMMNIREDKGLTYGISSSLLGYKDKSFIMVNTQTDCSKVSQVVDEIHAEIERLKNQATYTEDEIKRLSRFQLSNLAAVLDTPFTVMDLYQTELIAGTPRDYYYSQQNTGRHLSPEMIADVARRYFNTAKLCTVVAGA